MTPHQRSKLEAEAIRCGFEQAQPVIDLEELLPWAQRQGFRYIDPESIRQGTETRPGGRQLVFAAAKFAYRIRLLSDPPSLWLVARKDENSAPFLVGFWNTVDRESWLILREKILALEAGTPEALF
jgi:hypothetical protein